MSEAFTTSTARNIFYGGTMFFLLVFLAPGASFVPRPDSETAPGESHGEKGPAPDVQGEGGRA